MPDLETHPGAVSKNLLDTPSFLIIIAYYITGVSFLGQRQLKPWETSEGLRDANGDVSLRGK